MVVFLSRIILFFFRNINCVSIWHLHSWFWFYLNVPHFFTIKFNMRSNRNWNFSRLFDTGLSMLKSLIVCNKFYHSFEISICSILIAILIFLEHPSFHFKNASKIVWQEFCGCFNLFLIRSHQISYLLLEFVYCCLCKIPIKPSHI